VPVALWLALGAALALITSRVADWFVMTDELLYERLALSVVRLHSPLPHVHGDLVPSINQLYPLVLAPALAGGDVARDMVTAHILNAFVMSSAAVPALLLARRVTRSNRAAVFASVLTVAIPWIVLSSFLLTEVAAYPAFLWAVLAFQRATIAPSARNDVLAAGGLLFAVVARTQFAVLAPVLAAAILADAGSLRAGLRAHRALAAVFGAGLLVAIGVVATGHSVLGTYSAAAHGNPVPLSIIPSFAEHLATIGLGLAIVPFLAGGAWLTENVVRSANREHRVFALLATLTIVVLTFEVASYDLRFGGAIVRERYLFYIAPLILIAFSAALADDRLPRLGLLVPLVLLVSGFAYGSLPTFDKLNVDTPAAIVDNYLRDAVGGLTGARILLIAAAIVAVLLLLEGTVLLRHSRLALLLALLALVLLPAETGYAFVRLFRINGTAGRPLTTPGSQIFEWVDKTVGADAQVTAVPYPTNPGDYWSSVGYWWDLEFWNKSVGRSAGIPHQYEWTPSTFPKLALHFDDVGRASVSPPGYVAQSVSDARFEIAGSVVTNDRGLFLVKPEEPWRAVWLTTGLADDGWTIPGKPARIRVFSYPGQVGSVTRALTVYVRAPDGIASRRFSLSSNVGDADGIADGNEVTANISVCVPAHGSAEISLRAPVSSPIYGDPTSEATVGVPRAGGVLVTRIYLSGQIGAPCTS
jgi:hypothetical protein